MKKRDEDGSAAGWAIVVTGVAVGGLAVSSVLAQAIEKQCEQVSGFVEATRTHDCDEVTP